MNSKFLRFLTLFLQVICLAVIVGVCVYGIVVNDEWSVSGPFIETVVRASVLFLLTISYYKTSVSNFNPGNPFIMLFMLFMTIVELKILSVFTELTGWSILPARVSVRLHLFSQLMVYFLLAGYAINYQNNDHSAVTRFMLFGITGCLFLSIMIPATQDITGVWTLRAPYLLVTIYCSVSVLCNLILAFSESTKLGTLRHISTVMMLLGNYAMIYDNPTIALIGSCTFVIGAFISMILTLRNSVIL